MKKAELGFAFFCFEEGAVRFASKLAPTEILTE